MTEVSSANVRVSYLAAAKEKDLLASSTLSQSPSTCNFSLFLLSSLSPLRRGLCQTGHIVFRSFTGCAAVWGTFPDQVLDHHLLPPSLPSSPTHTPYFRTSFHRTIPAFTSIEGRSSCPQVGINGPYSSVPLLTTIPCLPRPVRFAHAAKRADRVCSLNIPSQTRAN